MNLTKLQAWYSHKQGLDGSLATGSAASVLAQTGWARSVGGVGPYLTLVSRAGIGREAADASVAQLDIYELPAVRNCTYVVPASHFALALKAGQSHWAAGQMRAALTLDVTEKEIDQLCETVCKALGKETLTPDEIRERVGKAARSLGEEGKKKGVTTTLPLALGKLQAYGQLRRVPINGRLDQQRYKYTLWNPNPLQKFKMSDDEVAVELAKLYFGWIAPASPAEFQGFSGLGVKGAKAAIADAGLKQNSDGMFFTPKDLDAFDSFKIPKNPQYSLVSRIDSISLLRRDHKSLLDPSDRSREFFGEKGSEAGESLMELPNHIVLDRGRIIGIWEYDAEAQEIVWVSFIKKNKDLQAAVAQTEKYVREQLGDARSFSLDSPKSRAPKIVAMRKAAL